MRSLYFHSTVRLAVCLLLQRSQKETCTHVCCIDLHIPRTWTTSVSAPRHLRLSSHDISTWCQVPHHLTLQSLPTSPSAASRTCVRSLPSALATGHDRHLTQALLSGRPHATHLVPRARFIAVARGHELLLHCVFVWCSTIGRHHTTGDRFTLLRAVAPASFVFYLLFTPIFVSAAPFLPHFRVCCIFSPQ